MQARIYLSSQFSSSTYQLVKLYLSVPCDSHSGTSAIKFVLLVGPRLYFLIPLNLSQLNVGFINLLPIHEYVADIHTHLSVCVFSQIVKLRLLLKQWYASEQSLQLKNAFHCNCLSVAPHCKHCECSDDVVDMSDQYISFQYCSLYHASF